jgi:hypothetical protein
VSIIIEERNLFAMTHANLFQLSRIYAQGWAAANELPADAYCRLTAEEKIALNPHTAEPQRSRWSDGFREAVQK